MGDDSEAMCMLIEHEANDIANYLPNKCRDEHGFPIVYGHYLSQSLQEGTLLEDLLVNDIGRLECAPGPYSLERYSEIDSIDKQWQLDAIPNYFIVHVDAGKFSDESFYLATQNGFPIHCQYYKLEQRDMATLVLLPKTKLSPGQPYFLYLTLNEDNKRKTWIQPLSLALKK